MACCSNKLYQKSVQTVYNNEPQTLNTTLTPISLLGSLVQNSGSSISSSDCGFIILKPGIYDIDCIITVNASTAGIVTLEGCLDNNVLPCTNSEQSVTADGVATLPIKTRIEILGTPCSPKTLSFKVSSTATGLISHLMASVMKVA